MILAIDFDGTITRDLPWGAPPVLRDGAADALRALHAAGHTLILHSCRFAEDSGSHTALECELFLRREGLWTLFETVWTQPGKPYADIYIDDRAQRLGDLGKALDGSANWGMLAYWYGGSIADPTPEWAGDGEPPRLMVWRRIGGVCVWLVDGPRVRTTTEYAVATVREGVTQAFDPVDFTAGGNGARYPWIPAGELWIDSAVAWEEVGFVALHEAVERYWMREGKSYAEAHEIASRIESKARKDPSVLERELAKACGVASEVAAE